MTKYNIGQVGRTHLCNNVECWRTLHTGADRIESESHRYCLLCGYEQIKKEIKMLKDDLKEIEKTHLKEIVAMRMTK